MNEVQRTVINKEHGSILSITATHILINEQLNKIIFLMSAVFASIFQAN